MIRVNNEIERVQKNFWNHCLFHPTDAVEDSWGRRILDKMAEDKSIGTIRIYNMLEDIVYRDMEGRLCCDFRLNDLRLDYLTEKGYDLIIAYGMMPECIATNKNATSSVCKNKTRYKGKLINTSVPEDYALWEEVCYEYTKHIVEKYGEETVSKWHLHCFNEPDISLFFMSDLPEDALDERAKEYCRLYEAFAKGVKRACGKLCIGGPALAGELEFLEIFLNYVSSHKLPLDYIALHNYGAVGPDKLNNNSGFCVDYWLGVMDSYFEVIEKCGFQNTEIVIDEWGMASHGYYNIEECPPFMARETEVFSAYYVKLIHEIIRKKYKLSKILICLSGQHEMVTDFSGMRNFFTMNFFSKPIYNAYVMASKLHEGLLGYEAEKNIFAVPTKNKNGSYAVLVTYSSEKFEENLPEIEEELAFCEDISDKTVTVYCIDKNTTNPYRLYQRKGLCENLTEEEKKLLRQEGNLKPFARFKANGSIRLRLTANAVYLVEVE